jgi:hypothetical protein
MAELLCAALEPEGIAAGVLHPTNGNTIFESHPFFDRLVTNPKAGLHRGYLIRIYVGFGLVVSTWLVCVFIVVGSCRPFHGYWQIYPNPGGNLPKRSYDCCLTNALLAACQLASSAQVLWTYCAMNVLTDFYLLLIPGPMLWNSTLPTSKKVGLLVLFSGGVFIIICSFLRTALIFVVSTR